jgi:hypothetical protein
MYQQYLTLRSHTWAGVKRFVANPNPTTAERKETPGKLSLESPRIEAAIVYPDICCQIEEGTTTYPKRPHIPKKGVGKKGSETRSFFNTPHNALYLRIGNLPTTGNRTSGLTETSGAPSKSDPREETER